MDVTFHESKCFKMCQLKGKVILSDLLELSFVPLASQTNTTFGTPSTSPCTFLSLLYTTTKVAIKSHGQRLQGSETLIPSQVSLHTSECVCVCV